MMELHEPIWSDDTEGYIKDLLKQCKNNLGAHYKAYKKCRLSRNIWATPTLLIPLAMSSCQALLKDEKHAFTMAVLCQVLYFISACCAGILHYYDFGGKANSHANSQYHYECLSNDIDLELSKRPVARRNCELMMVIFKMNYDRINQFSINI